MNHLMKYLRTIGLKALICGILLGALSVSGCSGGPQQVARVRPNSHYFEIFKKGKWEPFFMKGMNLSLAFPGYRPGSFIAKTHVYPRYIKMIADMNINTIRIYTLQPPAFYKAFRKYNLENPDKVLWLLQGVWLDEVQKEENDYLSSPVTTTQFREEIKRVVDAIHGNARVLPRPGWAYGVYKADVSRWTVGILLGREMEPYIVDSTNRHHKSKVTSFAGKYYTLKKGSPIDVWAAQNLEFTTAYEQENYRTQRPVGMSNWATLDPLKHVIEPPWSAEDVTSMDLRDVKTTAANTGGTFISYHLYPYYPNFVNIDPDYSQYKDHIGPNPYEGYLFALKKHYKNHALLAAEFGLPATMAPVHTSKSGMNHGMINEFKQATGVKRMIENIYRSGLAGGCIFVWIDEWFKRTWLLDPRQELARLPKWHNMMSAEETFGMVAIEAYLKDQTVTLGDDKTWKQPPLLKHTASDALPKTDGSVFATMQMLKDFRVQYDQAYLYLRIGARFLDPDRDGNIDWKHVKYLVGIDTYAPDRGESKLGPNIPGKLDNRIEFLLEIGGDAQSRPTATLKVIPSYDTYGIWHSLSEPYQVFRSLPSDKGIFNPLKWIMEDNLQDGRDTKKILQERQIFDIGKFRYGHQIPNQPGYDALAHFHANIRTSSISVRIPWNLLNVTDPSSRHVLHNHPYSRSFEHRHTPGFRFVVAALKPKEGQDGVFTLSDLLPGGPTSSDKDTIKTSKLYTWKKWEDPTYKERIRPIYYQLQKMLATYPEQLPAPSLKGGKP